MGIPWRFLRAHGSEDIMKFTDLNLQTLVLYFKAPHHKFPIKSQMKGHVLSGGHNFLNTTIMNNTSYLLNLFPLYIIVYIYIVYIYYIYNIRFIIQHKHYTFFLKSKKWFTAEWLKRWRVGCGSWVRWCPDVTQLCVTVEGTASPLRVFLHSAVGRLFMEQHFCRNIF